MRIEEIEKGNTYFNVKGLRRTVVGAPAKGSTGLVFYKRPNSSKIYQCWITSFAKWAKGIVQGEEMSFVLQCLCGKKNEGYFSDTDIEEKIHCDCGLAWIIPRPSREKV